MSQNKAPKIVEKGKEIVDILVPELTKRSGVQLEKPELYVPNQGFIGRVRANYDHKSEIIFFLPYGSYYLVGNGKLGVHPTPVYTDAALAYMISHYLGHQLLYQHRPSIDQERQQLLAQTISEFVKEECFDILSTALFTGKKQKQLSRFDKIMRTYEVINRDKTRLEARKKARYLRQEGETLRQLVEHLP